MNEDLKKKISDIKPAEPTKQDLKMAKLALAMKMLESANEQEGKNKPVEPKKDRSLSIQLFGICLGAVVSVVSLAYGKYRESVQQTTQVMAQVNQQRAQLESDLIKEALKDTSQTKILQRLSFLVQAGMLTDSVRLQKIDTLLVHFKQSVAEVKADTLYHKPEVTTLSLLTGNRDLASKYEDTGFTALSKRDLDGAIKAFNASEKSLNGYHSAYDIWFYLRGNKLRYMTGSDLMWNHLYDTVLNAYSYGMTDNIKTELKKAKK